MNETEFQEKIVIPRLSRISFLMVQFVMNETGKSSKKLGAIKKRKGLISGHSDLIIYDLKNNRIDFIELKGYEIGKKGQYINMGYQSNNQKNFENIVNSLGHEYFLIRNPDELTYYINLKLDKI